MRKGWGGWGRRLTPAEKARRQRARELKEGRRRKALVALDTLERADAVVILAGLFNWSQREAREWLKEHPATLPSKEEEGGITRG